MPIHDSHGYRSPVAQVDQPEPTDSELIELLVRRDGQPTTVELQDGRRLLVRNIAWGYDAGDAHAHVTTNISPSVDGQSTDFFLTSEVVGVLDESGRPLLLAE